MDGCYCSRRPPEKLVEVVNDGRDGKASDVRVQKRLEALYALSHVIVKRRDVAVQRCLEEES